MSDKIRERAALYALGALDAAEARVFAEHIASGCGVCEREVRAFEETAAALATSLPERRPAPAVRERLMERIRSESGDGPQIWKHWRETPAQQGPVHVVPGGEAGWQPVCAGVRAKQLYVDAANDSVTMLIRMDAGSTYPPHRHGGPEQCLVIEGDVRVGDLVLHAGDFQCCMEGSTHDVTSTEQGCLLLIVSSRHDQLMA